MMNYENIKLLHNKYINTIENKKIKDLQSNGIYKECFNQNIIENNANTFNIELPNTKIYNQGDSYLCWLYAYINFISPLICKKLNTTDENINISVNYLHFFDRLEKSNSLYENIINNSQNINTIINEDYLDTYINTYGSFNESKNIVIKYGIVPEKEMPMNYNNFEPFVCNKIFKEKIKSDILKLRKLNNTNEKELLKDKLIEENYILLSKIFGQPPINFNFNYLDTNKNEHELQNISPIDFLEFCYPGNLNDYIFVMNDSNKDFYTNHLYNYPEQIYNISPSFYNLPINDIKKYVIKQLNDGIPIWFGCDFSAMCGSYTNTFGILDSNLFDFKNILGLEILPKSEREKFDCCNYHHAMTIVGVQIENDKAIRWKVLNSFGKENNQEGYFVMNDNYFEDYATMFGINKKYISTLN